MRLNRQCIKFLLVFGYRMARPGPPDGGEDGARSPS